MKKVNKYLGLGFILLTLVSLGIVNRTTNKVKKEKFSSNMKNVFGKSLLKCRKNPSDLRGSWDSKGYCSELHGGVHQICFDVNDRTKNFARDTGQGSNWSLERSNKNHCMCLGAYALYKAKQETGTLPKTNNELVCSAIPEVALSDSYISTWNSWNGNELPNQIVNGVNSLVKQCLNQTDEVGKKYLTQKYLNLARNRSEFHSTLLYKRLSKN